MKTALFFVLACLGACAAKPAADTRVLVQKVPAYLLEVPEKPLFEGSTNADLLEYVLRLEQALEECSARLLCLRKE